MTLDPQTEYDLYDIQDLEQDREDESTLPQEPARLVTSIAASLNVDECAPRSDIQGICWSAHIFQGTLNSNRDQ